MRTEPWVGPPNDLRVIAMQAYDRKVFSRAPRGIQLRRLPAWLGTNFGPRTRMVMAGAVALVVLVMASVFLTTFRMGDPALAATVAGISGQVEYKTIGSRAWEALYEGAELKAGDRIKSGFEANAVLRFPDNSRTAIDSDSQLAILQLSDANDGNGQIVVLHQYSGSTEHDIQPQEGGDSWFEVETSAASIKVVGTKFGVGITDYQATVVTVTEGTVEVQGEGAAILVESGQTANVLLNSEAAYGLPTPPPCAPIEPTTSQHNCDENSQSTTLPSGSLLLSNEGAGIFDPEAVDTTASATRTGRLTPTVTRTPAATLLPGVTVTEAVTTPTVTPTTDGSTVLSPSPTPTEQASPPPTPTSPNPFPTTTPPAATPLPPTATQPPPPTSTPQPPPPTSTPQPPPPTSTPPPPPPTATPPPPPTSTSLPPPTATPPPPPTETPPPPPPTPTPPPYLQSD